MMMHQFQDGGRPPSWISILGHNFGVDQNYCTKFGIIPGWKIVNPRGPIAQKSGFRKSKMADGRHLEFRFLTIISALINIFAPNLVPG